jgi:hypothetical protein
VHPEPSIALNNPDIEKWIINNNIVAALAIMAETYGVTDRAICPGLDGLAVEISKDFGLKI